MAESDQEAQRSISSSNQQFARFKDRLKFDEDGVKKFTKVFEGFTTELEKTDKTMKGLVQTARELKGVFDKTKAPDMGGVGAGKTEAGGVPSNGNFLKTGVQYGAMRAAGALGLPVAAGLAAVHYGPRQVKQRGVTPVTGLRRTLATCSPLTARDC